MYQVHVTYMHMQFLHYQCIELETRKINKPQSDLNKCILIIYISLIKLSIDLALWYNVHASGSSSRTVSHVIHASIVMQCTSQIYLLY